MSFRWLLLLLATLGSLYGCGRLRYASLDNGEDNQNNNTPSCGDGQQNASETDVDCGGDNCPPCAQGGQCLLNRDCLTGLCIETECTTPDCADNLLSPGESDIDCGGSSCSACDDGRSCTTASDCASGVCTGNICQTPTCSDGVQNQDETDIDCGGSTCSACADDAGCTTASDCTSGVCAGNICQAPTCSDGVQNQDETDIDCGGSICSACGCTGSMTDSGEFLVNTGNTIGHQGQPSALHLSNGNYVLLYSGLFSDDQIHGRIVDSNGVEQVADWVISAGPYNMMPYGVDLGSGRFLVVWDIHGADGPIRARIYNYDGTASSAIFQVSAGNSFFDNLSLGGGYGQHKVGLHPVDVLSGDRVVFTYSVPDDVAMVRVFDTSTNPPTALHSELQVSANGANISATSVLTLSNGNFMAIWNNGWQPEIFTRVYDPSTNPPTPISSEYYAIQSLISSEFDTAVMPILLSNGTPVISYTGHHINTGNADGDLYGVYAARFTDDGLEVRDTILLNTTTMGEQFDAVLCPLTDGGMAAAWSSQNKDGSSYAMVGQIFNSDLSKIGNEFVINDTTTSIQAAGYLACGTSGFVATWLDSSGADGSGDGVFAKTYNNACSTEALMCPATNVEFRVNHYTPRDDWGFYATRLSDDTLAVAHASYGAGTGLIYVTHYDQLGNLLGGANLVQDVDYSAYSWNVFPLNNERFVVTWFAWDLQGNDSYGMRARIFNADFTPDGASFIVNPSASDQYLPAGTVLNASDDWMVTYTRSGTDVMFQRYNAAGNTLGTPVRVNSGSFNVEGGVGVQLLSNGNVVVVWQQINVSFSNFDIYGRVYDSSGTAVSSQFMVNTTTANDQKFTDANGDTYNFKPVTSLSNGNFVVVWSSDGQDGSNSGVYAQVFDPSTNPPSKIGGEIPVNTETNDHQDHPSVAAFDAGGFVVTWQSNLQDGSGYGIYAQRFDNAGNPDGSEVAINDTTLGIQALPMVSTLANDTYIVGYDSENFDGNGFGMAAKIVGICTP